MRQAFLIVSVLALMLALAACAASDRTATPETLSAQAWPIGSQVRSGPSVVATPFMNGDDSGLSFTQVQQRASFQLVEPQWMPATLNGPGIQVVGPVPTVLSGSGTPPAMDISVVWLRYRPRDPSQHAGIEIEEHDGGVTTDGCSLGTNPSQLTIAGRAISQSSWSDASGSFTCYTWENQSTTFALTAERGNLLTETDIERIIGSMLSAGSAADPPEATRPRLPAPRPPSSPSTRRSRAH